jgi:DhnA family fructose-bisphosphate aldolase class Ia
MRRFCGRGGAVVIPIDHGLYSEPAPAIKDLRKLVATIADTEADGILITPGMLEHVAGVLGDLNIVLRIDGTHTRLGRHLERTDLITSVESALSLGADMVVVNIFVGTENEDVLLAKLGAVATQSRTYGVPLMAEMLPTSLLDFHYGKEKKAASVEEINRDLCLVSRLAAEIGADCVKTQYSGDTEGFRHVVQSTPIPIWIAGGPKGEGGDAAFLNMIEEAVAAGATGTVIGRNVWQRENLREIINALCKILHNA